jgi:hypothetical protein
MREQSCKELELQILNNFAQRLRMLPPGHDAGLVSLMRLRLPLD